MRVIQNLPTRQEPAAIAQVSYAQTGGFGVVGESQLRGALIFAPRGVSYQPVVGDHLLMMPVAGQSVCAGAMVSTNGLQPGELRLTSSGGASILLTQSGDIVLNGMVTIRKDGVLLGRQGQVIGESFQPLR